MSAMTSSSSGGGPPLHPPPPPPAPSSSPSVSSTSGSRVGGEGTSLGGTTSLDDDETCRNNPAKWFFDKNGMDNTPSRKAGIDTDKELSYRQQAACFIQEMGQKLKVNQLCNNTAIVYMNRFYMFHSFTSFHRNTISIAAIFLAAKVEEQPRKLDHVVRVAHYIQFRAEPLIDPKSEAYMNMCHELVMNENILLQTLGFDLAVDHPHTHIIKCCQLVRDKENYLSAEGIQEWREEFMICNILASKDLGQVSYLLATNILHLTTMCVQYRPTLVATLAIHVACKWSGWQIPRSKEGKDWWKYVDDLCSYPELEELTREYLDIYNKAPPRLKLKVASFSSNKGGTAGGPPGVASSSSGTGGMPPLPPLDSLGTGVGGLSSSGPFTAPNAHLQPLHLMANPAGSSFPMPPLTLNNSKRSRSRSPSPKRQRVDRVTPKPGEAHGSALLGHHGPFKPHLAALPHPHPNSPHIIKQHPPSGGHIQSQPGSGFGKPPLTLPPGVTGGSVKGHPPNPPVNKVPHPSHPPPPLQLKPHHLASSGNIKVEPGHHHHSSSSGGSQSSSRKPSGPPPHYPGSSSRPPLPPSSSSSGSSHHHNSSKPPPPPGHHHSSSSSSSGSHHPSSTSRHPPTTPGDKSLPLPPLPPPSSSSGEPTPPPKGPVMGHRPSSSSRPPLTQGSTNSHGFPVKGPPPLPGLLPQPGHRLSSNSHGPPPPINNGATSNIQQNYRDRPIKSGSGGLTAPPIKQEHSSHHTHSSVNNNNNVLTPKASQPPPPLSRFQATPLLSGHLAGEMDTPPVHIKQEVVVDHPTHHHGNNSYSLPPPTPAGPETESPHPLKVKIKTEKSSQSMDGVGVGSSGGEKHKKKKKHKDKDKHREDKEKKHKKHKDKKDHHRHKDGGGAKVGG